MKSTTLSIIFPCIFLPGVSVSQQSVWSDESARTIPQSRFEVGLIHTPARYGLTEDVELSTYPLWGIFVPGVSVKKLWFSSDNYLLASSHGVYSPTPFLRFVAREKTGGLLPPDNYVPFFLVLDSYLLVSKPIADEHMATARIGGKLAVALSDRTAEHQPYERLQTIDYPFIFPRTAFLTRVPVFAPDVSLALSGPLIWNLGYSADCRFFLFGIRDHQREEDRICWAVEPAAVINWDVSTSFSCHLGVIYSAGSYPFGQNSVFYPLLDLRFGFGGAETVPENTTNVH
jgi:hypothetical protein